MCARGSAAPRRASVRRWADALTAGAALPIILATPRKGRRLRMGRLALVVALLLALATSSPASAAPTSVQRFMTAGYASAGFGDCPDTVALTPPGTVCTDTVIQLVREAVAIDGGGLSAVNTPWGALLQRVTLTFPATGDPVATDERIGFVPSIDDASVTYDRQHLAFASVRTDIPMSDGSAVAVDLSWQAISDRMVFGNDGPALSDFGLVRHSVDRCTTQVNQGHQKFRIAAMTGTVDGISVHSYRASPSAFISFNHFVFIDATHGPACA